MVDAEFDILRDFRMRDDDYPGLLYLRYLNLVAAIRSIPPFSSMDPTEEQLLNRLALTWHQGQKISVADVMRSEVGVSRTTTYRRLLGLKAKGMIDLVTDARDKRVKNVLQTQLATSYIEKMCDCIEQIVRHERTA